MTEGPTGSPASVRPLRQSSREQKLWWRVATAISITNMRGHRGLSHALHCSLTTRLRLKLAAVQFRRNPHEALPRSSHAQLAAPASEDPRIDLQETAGGGSSPVLRVKNVTNMKNGLWTGGEEGGGAGARLILAQARQMQCGLFGSVSACREARTFRCNRGPEHEGCLARVADVIARTDVPEASAVQQAETIFRRNGSEAGLADVLDNLGLVYEAKATPPPARKWCASRGHPSTHR